MQKGDLWLKAKPFSYRRLKGNGYEELGTGTDWTAQPQHPIDNTKDEKLDTLFCPNCSKSSPTKGMQIMSGVHFSNLRCKGCDEVANSKLWNCSCKTSWIKCRTHTLAAKSVPITKHEQAHRDLAKRKRDRVQLDHPLPKRPACHGPRSKRPSEP